MSMFQNRYAWLLIGGLVFLSACYYDKEDLLYGAALPCTDSTGTISRTLVFSHSPPHNEFSTRFTTFGAPGSDFSADLGHAQARTAL